MTIAFAHRRSRPPVRRRGAVLIVLIAVFAVIVGLTGVWARRIVAEQRRLRLVAERAQVEWLAEAGVRRAAARLLADPAFTGEEWSIPAEELGRSRPAAVLLRVEPADDAGAVRLSAVARYPAESPRVRATKTVSFPRPSEPRP